MKTIILPFRIFQIFMLSPFGLAEKTLIAMNKSNMKYASIAAIAINLAIFVHGLFITDVYIKYSEKGIQYYLDLFYITMMRILMITILAESLIKRDSQIKFFENVRKADAILTDKLSAGMEYDRNRKENNIQTGLWHFMFIATSVTQLVCWIIANDSHSVYYWTFTLLPSYIDTLRYFQMTTYVNVTRVRFEIINKTIKSFYTFEPTNKMKEILNKKNIQQSVEVEKYLIFKKLINLRQAYIFLYDATEIINDLFRLSVPMMVAKDFIDILTCVYWLFLWILNPSMLTLHLTVTSFAIIIMHMFQIISISNDCHYTVEEVCIKTVHI